MKKECLLYKKLNDNLVQCTCCSHYCVIKNWETWKCWIRQNIDWKLYLLTYWRALWLNTDPIEKKPLFHFLPWTKVFSFWTAWCNFACKFCQNYNLSQVRLKNTPLIEKLWVELTPEKAVDYCVKHKIPSIAFTYNEPTIFFEYAYDTMKLAKKAGLKTVFVSNWFQSKEFWEKSQNLIDAINIDLKWFSEDFYTKICGWRFKPILDNIKYIYEKTNIFLELTTLIIPGENDSDEELEKIADFIVSISKDIPWHISWFYPTYKMLNIHPTPYETLRRAYEIWKKKWINYIYVWNVIDSEHETTYCPKCNIKLIERGWYIWEQVKINCEIPWICHECGEKIPWVWE